MSDEEKELFKHKTGDEVWVPAGRLGVRNPPHALVTRRVLGHERRSVVLDVLDEDHTTTLVASSLVHARSLGYAVICVGDLTGEATLLDPLRRSVVNFLHLLIPETEVHAQKVRTLPELAAFWKLNADAFSHVLLLGHSDSKGIFFVDRSESYGAAEIVKSLEEAAPKTPPKTFISLACESGKSAFAKPFSEARVCKELIAPYQVIHGAAAAHYAQSLVAFHLLEGNRLVDARRKADKAIAGAAHMRYWKDGRMPAKLPAAD